MVHEEKKEKEKEKKSRKAGVPEWKVKKGEKLSNN